MSARLSVLDFGFTQATRFHECGANEGIPQCLGARLSRQMPGDPFLFQINTNAIHASARTDARLFQIFELLKKPEFLGIIPVSLEPTGGDESNAPASQSAPGSLDTSRIDPSSAAHSYQRRSSGDMSAQWRGFEGSFEHFLRHACGHSGSTLDQHYANLQSRFYREDAYRIFMTNRIFTVGLTLTWYV